VEYSLTPLETTVIPALDSLSTWAIKHMKIPMIDDDEIPLKGKSKRRV
jgi:DNA-binding HxlR family transcriptional regulator